VRFRTVASIIAFVSGFAVACAVISRFVKPVRASPIDAKLEFLGRRGAEFDTLIIGSSRVYRQIIPAVFDAEMAAHGVPVNSFNLSGDGMRTPEDMHVLDSALASRGTPLRLILSECVPIDSSIEPDDAGTARTVYWHDAARMGVLLRACFSRRATAAGPGRFSTTAMWERLMEFPEHIQHWAWNAGRIGSGSGMLDAALFARPRRAAALDERDVESDGWRGGVAKKPFTGKELADYEEDLAIARKHRPEADYDNEESQATLRWKRDLALRHGARLVLIATPYPRTKVFTPRDTAGIIFLDHTDPDRFPELYQTSLRRDHGHLNPAGAAIYSRLVARQIADALKQGR
jgi:hypothetical protein